MKVTKQRIESYTYVIELSSYDAIQLRDVLAKAQSQHRDVHRLMAGREGYRPLLSPQEENVVDGLESMLSSRINGLVSR
jgi:hypothetical protein